MAVQPQYPASNVVLPADRSNRSGRPPSAVGNDNRSFLTPGLNLNSFLSKFQIQQPAVGGPNQLRIFNQLTGGRHAYPTHVNVAATHAENEGNVPAAAGGSRKRGREVGDDIASQWHQQHQQHQQHLLSVPNFHQTQTTGPGSVVNPQSTTAAAAAAAGGGVSTGLRLAFENDRLRSTSPVSTSGRPEVPAKNLVASMAEDFSSHLQKERDEIEHLLKIQGEQVRQLLEEKRQRHCHQLIAAVEVGFSRKLREKDLEAEKVKHQNQELLDRLQHLSAESINWKNKLRQSEQNINVLRSSLHQASQQQPPYALNREQQSKEGCGDSEVDDCASSYVDDRIDAHARTFNENKELREQWTCRVCRCKDVSMLLLPCRHLCLCKDCEGQLDACPLCRAPKNASVQVYMS